MQTDHLKTFVAVATYQSFSKAAKVLNLSQPAVSHQVNQLEAYFETKLFERTNRRVSLTKSGKVLLAHAHDMLQLLNKIHLSIASTSTTDRLKIGCSNTIGEVLIPHLIHSFTTENPSLKADLLQISVSTSYDIADKLDQNEIDVALVEGFENKYPFIKEPFYEDEIILACSPVHPAASIIRHEIDAFESFTWLIREPGCSIRKATLHYWDNLKLSPTTILEFNNNQLIKEGVKNGLGIAGLSRTAVQKDLDEGNLIEIPLKPPLLTRSFYIMRKSKTFHHHLAKRFWNHVVNNSSHA